MVGQGAWRISNGPCTPCDGKHTNLISRICFHTRTHTHSHGWGSGVVLLMSFFFVYLKKWVMEKAFNNPTPAPSFFLMPILASVPPAPLLKRSGGAPKPWPIHPHSTGPINRTKHCPPPHLPLFHTRHAEESAERPHLVTIVRPCGQSTLRKVNSILQFSLSNKKML